MDLELIHYYMSTLGHFVECLMTWEKGGIVMDKVNILWAESF